MLRKGFSHASFTLYHLTVDFIRLLGSFLQSRSVLAAENLFLRKQLSLYQERQVRPHRATHATRLTMILVAKLFDWKTHYNQGRPHSSLGPGLPEAGKHSPVPIQKHRHQLQEGYRVESKAILGGLHHEYRLEKIAA